MLRQTVAFAASLLACTVHAADGVYAGAGVGHGQTGNQPAAAAHVALTDAHADSTTWGAFVGYRWRWLAGEGGVMRLPTYGTRAFVDSYSAYKVTAPGSYPDTADIRQDITARGLYLRLNAYAPKVGPLEPYGFLGSAWVRSNNHEYGHYNGTDAAEFRIDLSKRAWLLGAGVQFDVTKRLTVRAEAYTIPGATESYWTDRRSVVGGQVQLVVSF